MQIHMLLVCDVPRSTYMCKQRVHVWYVDMSAHAVYTPAVHMCMYKLY